MADTESIPSDEASLIQYYFNRGYSHKEILSLLLRLHNVQISKRTLKRRLKSQGLRRRNAVYDADAVRENIRVILDGPGCLGGYRAVWHTLCIQGIQVPRTVVQTMLKELDPEGSRQRRAHRLKRREYHNSGPNFAWHADGYDKLKPYGFPIHGCIDGWSRKILWLHVTRSNNLPDNIATYFLDAVEEFGGCPVNVITDLGTENGVMAGIQAFFREDSSSHRYVSSPQNQRIEAWWSILRKTMSSWWINFFKDLLEQGIVDTTNTLHMECLWFCFAGLLQRNLNQAKTHWNTHYVRKSRHDTISGKPNFLYYMPETHNGESGLIKEIPENEFNYVRNNLVQTEVQNDYQEYFQYVLENCNISQPSHWREALQLFHTLLNYAEHGS